MCMPKRAESSENASFAKNRLIIIARTNTFLSVHFSAKLDLNS